MDGFQRETKMFLALPQILLGPFVLGDVSEEDRDASLLGRIDVDFDPFPRVKNRFYIKVN